MTSFAVRRPAANTTSIREDYVSSPRRNIYSASVNLSVKVLDLVQFGGPKWTVDRTVFEMWGVPNRLFVDLQELRYLPPRRAGVLHAPGQLHLVVGERPSASQGLAGPRALAAAKPSLVRRDAYALVQRKYGSGVVKPLQTKKNSPYTFHMSVR